jgi:integrase
MGTIYARGRKLYVGYRDTHGKWKYAATGLSVGQEKKAAKVLAMIVARIGAGAEHGERELGPLTLRRFGKQWIAKRKQRGVRNVAAEEGRLKKHVYPHVGTMILSEIRPKHIVHLVEELRAKGTLAPRSLHHVYGMLHTLFRDAQLEELVDTNPCVLGPAQLGPKEDKDPEWRATAIYTRAEVECLVSSELVPWDRQVLYALQALAGLRFGEVAGLRWRNYDGAAKPLGQLVVARSYAHASTKTGRPRLMPVHPVLASMLAEWKLKGWAEMLGRRPESDDLIVPSREGEMRSRHHSRNKLLDDLKRLGMRPRRGHDLRRTFITLARVDGARSDLLQMVTHNPTKNIVDIYTSMPWPSLCAEVAKLNVQRRKGELIPLPLAASAEGSVAQMAMFDAEGKPQRPLQAPATTPSLTSVLTSVQDATRPDPKKLWDVRPLLKKALVEALGIEPITEYRQKPSRAAYLTNNALIFRKIFVPSRSTQFPRNSSLAAESRPSDVHGRLSIRSRGACLDSHLMAIIQPCRSNGPTAFTCSSPTTS